MVLLAGLARAGELQPLYAGLDSPWTVGTRNGAIGLGRPLTFGLGPEREITFAGRYMVVAPRVAGKWTLWRAGPWAVAVEGGVGCPTWGLRLLQGRLLAPGQVIPWTIVPSATLLAGHRAGDWAFSVRAEERAGIPLTDDGTLTFSGLSWLDPTLAPVVNGWALELGARADWTPDPRWVVSADVHVELSGGPDLRGQLFALRAVGAYAAVGLGVTGAWDTPAANVPDRAELGLAVLPSPLQHVLPVLDVQTRW